MTMRCTLRSSAVMHTLDLPCTIFAIKSPRCTKYAKERETLGCSMRSSSPPTVFAGLDTYTLLGREGANTAPPELWAFLWLHKQRYSAKYISKLEQTCANYFLAAGKVDRYDHIEYIVVYLVFTGVLLLPSDN